MASMSQTEATLRIPRDLQCGRLVGWAQFAPPGQKSVDGSDVNICEYLPGATPSEISIQCGAPQL